MKHQYGNIDRFNAFSDGVFAVLITILVLDLRPPTSPTLDGLLLRWPTWLSYAVSYLFLAIVWVNHHHLMRCAKTANPRLIWLNFAHLFAASFVPFSTAWIAASRLSPFPVALYAADFVLVNLTYIALRSAVAHQLHGIDLQIEMAPLMKMRALFTLGVFTLAAIVSLRWPGLGIALICFCLLLYVRPDVPGVIPKQTSTKE